MLKLLIAKHSNINVRTSKGRTALHFASVLQRVNEVQILLDAGADVNVVDDSQLTPLTVSVELGREQTDILLVEHVADMSVKNSHGATLFHLVALSGSLGLADYLIHAASTAGLNVVNMLNTRDNEGLTAVDVAHKSHHIELAHLFMRFQRYGDISRVMTRKAQHGNSLDPDKDPSGLSLTSSDSRYDEDEEAMLTEAEQHVMMGNSLARDRGHMNSMEMFHKVPRHAADYHSDELLQLANVEL